MIFVPVAPQFETRTIIAAQGLDFTNARFRMIGADALLIPDAVKKRLKDLDVTSGITASYFNKDQGVLYNLKLIFDKDEFKQCLETPGLMVIYSGHSRLGRGNCFGSDIFQQPGEDWENGTEPQKTGMFRMGYPFVPVMVSDVHHHGYTAYPVPSSKAIPKEDCHPMLQAAHSKVKQFTTSELEKDLKIADPHNRPHWRIDDPDQLFGKFWGVDMVSLAGTMERHVVCHAGWTKTVSDPMDLGATQIRCRAYCVFSCSTQMHYAKIVRDRKGWKQQGDEGYAFFTTDPAAMDIAPSWIYHMMTYKKFSAGKPWKDLLDYTKNMTNIDLANAGRSYRVV